MHRILDYVNYPLCPQWQLLFVNNVGCNYQYLFILLSTNLQKIGQVFIQKMRKQILTITSYIVEREQLPLWKKRIVNIVKSLVHQFLTMFNKNRSQIPQIISNFAAMVQTQFSRTIKIFRTDNAMEYKKTDIFTFLSQKGTVIQCFCKNLTTKWTCRTKTQTYLRYCSCIAYLCYLS